MRCTVSYPSCSTIDEVDRKLVIDDFVGTWRSAAEYYAAEFLGKKSVGAKTPKGIQKYLNLVIDDAMQANGWEGNDGRFFRGNEWMRVSFRHRMSLGSDLLDAIRMHKSEGFERLTVVAASGEFLKVISPSDAASLCSSEDYQVQIDLNSKVLGIPICVGRLEPVSLLDSETSRIVNGRR